MVDEIITLVMGNLIGVAFGILMYRMATNAIKEMANEQKMMTLEISKQTAEISKVNQSIIMLIELHRKRLEA